MIENWLIRSSHIWKNLKRIIEDKWLTISEVAKKIGSSQPTLSNTLKWKWWSDEYFKKVWIAIWLKESEIKEIFKKADQEEYKYKYWEEINTLEDIDFDVMLSRDFWITDEQAINDIKKYIKFIRDNK